MASLTIKQDITKAKQKKLQSAANSIEKGMKIIEELGYSSYLTPSRWHIMNGHTHTDETSPKPMDQNMVAGFWITNTCAGDW